MTFATREEIYRKFQEDDTPDVLLGTMRLLGTGITLTRARQIVIVDLDYNASSGDQAEKRISRIGQTNESIAHILLCTDVKIEQEIRKRHDKRQQVQNMTMRRTWIMAMQVMQN